MRIFLTGGTGYMGGALLDRLVADGFDVLALARPERRPALESGKHLEWVFGTLDDARTIARAASQADAAIHLAAQHDSHMEALDRSAIGAIADGLRGSGKAFITTSATPVYGDTGKEPRDEHEPVEDPHPMRVFRLEHDHFVVGLNEEGIRGVVIRPPFVYGRAAGLLVTFIRQAREGGIARTVGDGDNRWSTVHVDDLADLYVRALTNPRARGAYNAASDDVVSMKSVAAAIAEAFGPGIAFGSWTVAEAVARLGDIYSLMALEQRVSSLRARNELGWQPGPTTLLADLTTGSYRQGTLVTYSH